MKKATVSPLSTPMLLARLAQKLEEQAKKKGSRAKSAALKPSHQRLLSYLEKSSLSVGALAEQVGVSKQAISVLVGELAERGLVEKTTPDDDKRVQIVRLTSKGTGQWSRSQNSTQESESELSALLGKTRVAALRENVQACLAALEDASKRAKG